MMSESAMFGDGMPRFFMSFLLSTFTATVIVVINPMGEIAQPEVFSWLNARGKAD